jgi:pantothenate kinase type III
MTLMTLYIDAGNTRIKFAVADNSELGFHTIDHCATSFSVAEITAFLQQALVQDIGLNSKSTSTAAHKVEALGVCVAGDAVKATLEKALHIVALSLNQHIKPTPDICIHWLSGLTPLAGLRNDYATPATLGADRWLAAYGLSQQLAAQSNTQAAVLATFGTATTVDVLHWDLANHMHVFVGGIIIAGIHTALRSVSSSTAQLPDMQTALGAAGETAFLAIPNNTADALTVGALFVQAGAVRGMMTLAAQHNGNSGATQCYIAGGAAPLIHPYLPQATLLDYPVIQGLARTRGSLKIAQ